LIDSFYARFLEVVHQNRKDLLSMEEIKKLADGRVYSGKDALKLKLVDGTGYFEDAIKKTEALAKIKNASVIAYSFYPKRKTNIYANAQSPQNPISLDIPMLKNLLPQLKTGIYYLWMPSVVRR
jgi:protease-4